MELDAINKDYFSELLSMGACKAASILGRMVGEDVVLTLSDGPGLSDRGMFERLEVAQGQRVMAVKQTFSGALFGDALLLFSHASCRELVQALSNEEIPLEVFSEMEQEAFTEVGNVILGACLESLVGRFDQMLGYSMPVFIYDGYTELLQGKTDSCLNATEIFRVCLSIKQTSLECYLKIMLDVASVKMLVEYFNQSGRGVA